MMSRDLSSRSYTDVPPKEDLFHRAFSARLLRLTLQGPLEGEGRGLRAVQKEGPGRGGFQVDILTHPDIRRSAGLLLCGHGHLGPLARPDRASVGI